MRTVFSVFHVSQLKKCLRVPEEHLPARNVEVEPDLTYVEEPREIVGTKERITRNRVVKTYKVLWGNHGDSDATWETEEYLRENYPQFARKWLVTPNLRMSFS